MTKEKKGIKSILCVLIVGIMCVAIMASVAIRGSAPVKADATETVQVTVLSEKIPLAYAEGDEEVNVVPLVEQVDGYEPGLLD